MMNLKKPIGDLLKVLQISKFTQADTLIIQYIGMGKSRVDKKEYLTISIIGSWRMMGESDIARKLIICMSLIT